MTRPVRSRGRDSGPNESIEDPIRPRAAAAAGASGGPAMQPWADSGHREIEGVPADPPPTYHEDNTPTMSVSTLPHQHVVLEGISFETYERMLKDLSERHIRLTYD